MSWTKRELKRSYPCNAHLIKSLRLSKGWSQKQFAKQAGYSERLISKAESGGRISNSTIEILALALSSNEQRVFPKDLIIDASVSAKSINRWLHEPFFDVTGKIAEAISRDVVVSVCGDPALHPFSGTYYGLEGIEEMFRKYFRVFEFALPSSQADTFVCFFGEDEVVMWGETRIRVKDTLEEVSIPLTRRMQFQDDKLITLEDRYDLLPISSLEKQDRISKTHFTNLDAQLVR